MLSAFSVIRAQCYQASALSGISVIRAECYRGTMLSCYHDSVLSGLSVIRTQYYQARCYQDSVLSGLSVIRVQSDKGSMLLGSDVIRAQRWCYQGSLRTQRYQWSMFSGLNVMRTLCYQAQCYQAQFYQDSVLSGSVLWGLSVIRAYCHQGLPDRLCKGRMGYIVPHPALPRSWPCFKSHQVLNAF